MLLSREHLPEVLSFGVPQRTWLTLEGAVCICTWLTNDCCEARIAGENRTWKCDDAYKFVVHPLISKLELQKFLGVFVKQRRRCREDSCNH